MSPMFLFLAGKYCVCEGGGYVCACYKSVPYFRASVAELLFETRSMGMVVCNV
jgi:hypothetical protein